MLRKALLGTTAAMIAGAAFLASGPAMAGGHVNWSVNVGAGVPVYAAPVYAAPQPMYAQPPVVYAPQPVYVQPQPVYYGGFVPYSQVVYYDAWRRPYYVQGGRPVYVRNWHGHHPHGHR